MLLRAEHVSYGYRGRGSAPAFELRDVSLEIPKDSISALLGPNGGGKTTLVSLLAGVRRPQQGRVLLEGVDLSGLGRRQVARRIAVVPQETHPAFDYTVMEMVLMGRHPHLGAFSVEGPRDVDIAREALAATDTGALADRPYMTLSGGEKQRVIIASALAQAPDVLLLDEPTASLDLAFQLEIASLLTRLNRERHVTIVLATHDLNLAGSLCTNVIMVREGRVLADGPTSEVLTSGRIRDLYGVDADVRYHETTGRLTVVPLRRLAR